MHTGSNSLKTPAVGIVFVPVCSKKKAGVQKAENKRRISV